MSSKVIYIYFDPNKLNSQRFIDIRRAIQSSNMLKQLLAIGLLFSSTLYGQDLEASDFDSVDPLAYADFSLRTNLNNRTLDIYDSSGTIFSNEQLLGFGIVETVYPFPFKKLGYSTSFGANWTLKKEVFQYNTTYRLRSFNFMWGYGLYARIGRRFFVSPSLILGYERFKVRNLNDRSKIVNNYALLQGHFEMKYYFDKVVIGVAAGYSFDLFRPDWKASNVQNGLYADNSLRNNNLRYTFSIGFPLWSGGAGETTQEE